MKISEKPCECRFTINRGFKVAISSCNSNVKEGKLTIGFNFTNEVNVRMLAIDISKKKRNMVKSFIFKNLRGVSTNNIISWKISRSLATAVTADLISCFLRIACVQTLLSTKRARERLWVGWRFLVLVTWIFPRFMERPLIRQCFIWIIDDKWRYFNG